MNIELSSYIERQPLNARHWLALVLCTLVVTFDGFNAQVMGYVAPSLTKAWHIPAPALGPVISSGLVGLMLGALVLGTLGDRLGRKTIVLAATLLFGIFSLLTSFATSPSVMLGLRFLTGLGLGGAMPAAIALISEYVPERSKTMMVTITVGGFAIGPAIGGFVGAHLIASYGWTSMFVLGGVIPICLVPVLWLLLPESPRFLVAKKANPSLVSKNLRKVFPAAHFAEATRYTHREGILPKAAVREVFADGRLIGSLLLWGAIFFNLVGINLQTNWLPLEITSRGYSIPQAVTATAGFHVGGAIGGLVLSVVVRQLNIFRAIGLIFLFAAITTVCIGLFGTGLGTLRLTIFLAGIFAVGGQAALNALSGLYYPSFIRSTGSGWALAVGRLGAAVGPLVGSLLASLHLNNSLLFYIEAIPFLLCGVAVALIPRNDSETGTPELATVNE